MRRIRIGIIGGGQAGMQLALSLPRDRYEVTVISDRSPHVLRTGRVTSTQVMFAPALDIERAQGLHLWEAEAPAITGINVTVTDPAGTAALDFHGDLDGYAQSVDQRAKMAAWMEMFTGRGGKLVIHPVMTSELAELARMQDLTIIAAGKGALVRLFDRDPSRSPYTEPQRRLSVIYVQGRTPVPDESCQVRITVLPGIGELFIIPALTVDDQPCEILFFEAVPGGVLDAWDSSRPAGEQLPAGDHLNRTLELMRQYVPWEYERYQGVRPTDERCNLVGAYTPIVRRPVAFPAQNTPVLGMGDVVVANDPIAGQGANNAAHCAEIYREEIIKRGDEPFDAGWMTRTFERYWDTRAQYSTDFSNALLRPLPEHAQRLLAAAAANPAVADRFANGYAHPEDFAGWFLSPDRAAVYLNTVASAP